MTVLITMSGRNVPEGRAKDAQGVGQNPRAWPAQGRATLQVASVVVAISLAVFALSHLAPVRLTGVHLAPAGAEGVSRRKSVAGSISGLDDGATVSARALTKRTPGREAASADISGGRPAPAQCSAACSSRATEVVHHVPYVGVCLAVKGETPVFQPRCLRTAVSPVAVLGHLALSVPGCQSQAPFPD